MGKTRDLFKKIRDTKGTFHAKMGTIKDRFLIYNSVYPLRFSGVCFPAESLPALAEFIGFFFPA